MISVKIRNQSDKGSKTNNHDRYGEWVYLVHESENPKSVKEALLSPEKDKWIKAMESEMESLNKNEVLNLVELPEERKSVGCKWMFKKNYVTKLVLNVYPIASEEY